jgi:peptidyl-prolyl cis-trans isomerase B (cyclophilin B)
MQRRAEAQQHARKRNVLVGAAVAVAVVAAAGTAWALSGSDGDKKDAAAAPTPTAAAPVKGCTTPAPGSPNGKQFKSEPAMTVDTKAAYTMTLDTSCGKITIALDAAKAPHTVNSFAFLSNEKYFDHTKCHRLTTEGIYVLQCGDPTGTGSGGPGYQFADENLTGATYPAGTVAMANAGPGTNGSQFFLVYKDTQLPPSYTPFGKVTGGLDVVQNIASGGVQGGGADGAPVADMVLNSVTTAKG